MAPLDNNLKWKIRAMLPVPPDSSTPVTDEIRGLALDLVNLGYIDSNSQFSSFDSDLRALNIWPEAM